MVNTWVDRYIEFTPVGQHKSLLVRITHHLQVNNAVLNPFDVKKIWGGPLPWGHPILEGVSGFLLSVAPRPTKNESNVTFFDKYMPCFLVIGH